MHMRNIRGILYTIIASMIEIPGISLAGQSGSVYDQLYTDVSIGSVDTAALTKSITLAAPSWVYFQTDGRVWPSGGGSIPSVWITVDGVDASNRSVVDWSVSHNPQQHSINAVGVAYLSAGTHSVTLHAKSLNSKTFALGSDTNLSALIGPATTVTSTIRGSDSGTLSYNVNGLNGQSVLPTNSQVNLPVNSNAGQLLVAVTSSRIYRYGHAGDPLTTIGLDGATLPNNRASWSDNDMYEGAENQAPFFSQALIPNIGAGSHTISLLTTSLPYTSGSNDVQYRMGGDAIVVALQGGMSVVGAAPAPSDAHNVTNYICVATNVGWTGCPATGSDVIITEADIVVPPGHNGIVMISGKTRIQGDASDAGGVGYLWLTIDGTRRGSMGVQQLASPDSVSTRTLGTSYLATGVEALASGTHHVVLYAKATGNFQHLAMTKDLPLIWFD